MGRTSFSRVEEFLQAYPEHDTHYDICSDYLRALNGLREAFLRNNGYQKSIFDTFVSSAEVFASTARNTECDFPGEMEKVMTGYLEHQNNTLNTWEEDTGVSTLRQAWIMRMFAEEFIRQSEEIFRDLCRKTGYEDATTDQSHGEDEEWTRSLMGSLKGDSTDLKSGQERLCVGALDSASKHLLDAETPESCSNCHTEPGDDQVTALSTYSNPVSWSETEESERLVGACDPETQASDVSSNNGDSSGLFWHAFQRANDILWASHVMDGMPCFDCHYRRPDDLFIEP